MTAFRCVMAALWTVVLVKQYVTHASDVWFGIALAFLILYVSLVARRLS